MKKKKSVWEFFSEKITIVTIKGNKVIKHKPALIKKFSDLRRLVGKTICWSNEIRGGIGYIYHPQILRSPCYNTKCRSFTDLFSLEDSMGTAFDRDGNGVDLRNQVYTCKKHKKAK